MLNNIDQALADLYKFNNELISLDKTLSELDNWSGGKAQVIKKCYAKGAVLNLPIY